MIVFHKVSTPLINQLKLVWEENYAVIDEENKLWNFLSTAIEDTQILVLGGSPAEQFSVAEKTYRIKKHLNIIIVTAQDTDYQAHLSSLIINKQNLHFYNHPSSGDFPGFIKSVLSVIRQRNFFKNSINQFNQKISAEFSPTSYLKEYLEEVLQYAPIGALIISPDGNIEAWNINASKFLNEEDLNNKFLWDLFPESEQIKLRSFISNALYVKNNSLSETFFIVKDINTFYYDITATRLSGSSGNLGFLIIMTDVTDRELTAIKLKISNLRLQRAEESSFIMITHIDLDGNWIKVPPSFCKLLGYTESELLNMNVYDICHPDDYERDRYLMNDLLTGKIESYELEKRKIKKSGDMVWVYLNRSLVKNESDKPLFFLSFVLNIDDVKKKEELIKAYNEELNILNRNKNKIFSLISHDIRSPIHSIFNMSKYLLEDQSFSHDEETKEILEGINTSSNNIIGLLENLLEWTKFQTGFFNDKNTELNIMKIIEFVMTLIQLRAKDKNISVIVDSSCDLSINSNEKILISIIQNLLTNAVKFTPAGGKITVNCCRRTDTIDLYIKDSGIGMDQEQITSFYEAKSMRSRTGTANEKGSGLGLLLVKDFVRALKGKIKVQSVLRKGTTFTVTLPVN